MTTTSQTSADTDVVSLDSAATLEPVSPAPVLITEQEVLFNTAVATLVQPATTHRRWPEITLFAAVRRIHIRLPDARPVYPRLETSYFETARMSRMMDRL
jgi:hypothetical protein